MKCPECGGVGRIHYGEEWCSACNGTGEVQTNEEWLHTLNTEQLAEEIYKLVWCSNELFQQMECSGIDTKENDLKIVTEWLKQPHTTTKE